MISQTKLYLRRISFQLYMEDTLVFPPVVSTRAYKIKPARIYLKPSQMLALSPRSWLKSRVQGRLLQESPEENVPEMISKASFSKDLISPYSIKTKELVKLSSTYKYLNNSMNLPSLPSFKFRLKKQHLFFKNSPHHFLLGSKKKLSLKEKSHSPTTPHSQKLKSKLLKYISDDIQKS